ncbi:MAG TPA: GrpB family protein [Gemmatimonadaceae bacterium]
MIVLVPYDPRWPDAFAREAAQLAQSLGDVPLELHHMGSTAVPGILAKPVIDMLLIVPQVEALDARGAAFASVGYEAMGEFGIVGRRYFRKDDHTGRRTHQVHAFSAGSLDIVRHLDFRDYVRAHSDVRDAYAALKQRLAAECVDDMQCYSEGKTSFIRDIERRAAIWKSAGQRDDIDHVHRPNRLT